MVGLHSNMSNVTVIHLPGSPQMRLRDLKNNPSDSCELICDRFLTKPIKSENKDDYLDILASDLQSTQNTHENLSYFYPCIKDASLDFDDRKVDIYDAISMTSSNVPLDEEDQIGPYSLVSVHQTIVKSIESSQHFTTVTIGERDSSPRPNKRLMCFRSYADNEQGGTSCGTNTDEERLSHEATLTTSSLSKAETKVAKPLTRHQESQVSLEDVELKTSTLFDFSHSVGCQRADLVSPFSSTYSSAYTLTEHELTTSDSSTSPLAHKHKYESINHTNISDSWSEDSELENCKGKVMMLPKLNQTEVKMRSNVKIGEELLKFQYPHQMTFSCRLKDVSTEEREKGNDEIWVTNEAAHSCQLSDCFPPKKPPPLKELLHDCRRAKLNSPIAETAVLLDHSVSTDANARKRVPMITLMPPVCDVILQRRHFTNRQRLAEVSSSSAMPPKGIEEDSEEIWNKENLITDEKDTQRNSILTSTTDNRPSKRFSFLIRSSELQHEKIIPQSPEIQPKCSSEVAPNVKQITPSDKAILDRLSKLNLIQSPSSNTSRPRLGPATSQPPCARCREPVYAQELIRPTAGLFFHNACFKCYTCGLRLNLRTFYRSSSQEKDNRVFCRLHLPSSDVRPTFTHSNQNQKAESGTTIIKCDSIGLRYF